MKKIILGLFFVVSIALLAGCQQNISITGDETVSLKEGDTLSLDVTTDDTKGLTFASSNESVVTVNEEGTITAVAIGNAVITITSKSNEDVSFEVQIQVTKRVTLTSTVDEIILTEGNEETVTYESNDDVTFSSSSQSIFTVDAEGVITAVAEGNAVLTITAVNDSSVTHEIDIIVRKIVTLTVVDYEQEMISGDEGQINVTSEDGYTFESSDDDVLTVSATGLVTAISAGTATITVTSTYDLNVSEDITIRVYDPVDTLVIEGSSVMNLYAKQTLEAALTPVDAYPYIIWTSSNLEIATIDEEGIITVKSAGLVTFTATSEMNDTILDTIEINIMNQVIVDSSITSGTLVYEALTYVYEQDLFSSIEDALDVAQEGTTILVNDGNYLTDITLDVDGISLIAITDLVYVGNIMLDANDISLSGLNMQGAVSITTLSPVENVSITGLTASNITQDFIVITGTKNGLTIKENNMTNIDGFAIKVTGYESGVIDISKNIITDATQAISVTPATTVDVLTTIKVERNDISLVKDGIIIETNAAIHAYARFNSVVDATGFLAKSNVGNEVEFTLNHWGSAELNLAKFDNITEAMLLGHYALKADIISETIYVPTIPAKIMINNPIEEIMIGDTYQLSYTLLPYDLETIYIKWITSSPTISYISQEGTFTPVRSGDVTFTVRSSQNTSIKASITVRVITYPGIELKPNNPLNHNIVGGTLQLDATPFPVSIEDSLVSFVSSDETIATITIDGLISLHLPGVVTITASLTDDPSVKTDYTFEVYTSFDDNNLMDILTKSMVTYTTPHRWTAFGVGFDYNDFKYESVSRYYFGDYEINQSKMVPVSSGIRPGEPMDPHPEGVTQYNSDNVYWVVIHDTANTNPGSGALAHANYLYGNAMAGVELWASWHFTIDDKAIYQHIPTNERAYHAGDGSTRPGTATTYLGGGNRNGIGIETGVNQDADVYRTWQRTAKLGTDLLIQYNLPLTNMKYHVDFSGKNCPQTMRTAGLVPLFEEMKSTEYRINKDFAGAEISFVSNNLEYVDNTGRVIKMPDQALTVSYTVTVTYQDETISRTFYSYLPGTIF
jgi:N-acetylmuramoyl-L-alanine amidase